jgi:uncharacterized protein YlxW (UPF0749 family)
VWQVSGLSLVLGVMLALAVNTTTHSPTATEANDRFGVAASLLSRYKNRNDYLQSEVVKLQGEVKKAMAGVEDESNVSTEKKEFDRLLELSGRSAASGSGIRVTVRDSTAIPRIGEPTEGYAAYMVHDQDLNFILNDLKAAGVEHLGISGVDTDSIQRVVVTTTARCVGPTAVVNGTPLSAPYHIYAIGDRQLLRQYLERPDGYIRGPRQLEQRKMVAIEDMDEISLPEFASISARYAKPVAAVTK